MTTNITLPKKNPWAFRLGVAVSICWIVACGILICWKRGSLDGMKLNEFGDFAAGAFAPLAFLWLVLGYLQQGEDLRLNREALLLQAKELANSVQQQQALVEVSHKQVDATREATEYERHIRDREAEPEVRVLNGGLSNSNVHYKYSFRIENAGATVTDVKVFFARGSEDPVFVRKIPIFSSGKGEDLHIEMIGAIASDSALTFEYVKRNGNSGSLVRWIRPRVMHGSQYLDFD